MEIFTPGQKNSKIFQSHILTLLLKNLIDKSFFQKLQSYLLKPQMFQWFFIFILFSVFFFSYSQGLFPFHENFGEIFRVLKIPKLKWYSNIFYAVGEFSHFLFGRMYFLCIKYYDLCVGIFYFVGNSCSNLILREGLIFA